MPYITQERRKEFRESTTQLVCAIESHGELNYVLSRIATGWLLRMAGPSKPRYTDRQHLYGTLCAVAAEFYRRALAKYEDGAIKKNGDLTEYDQLDR